MGNEKIDDLGLEDGNDVAMVTILRVELLGGFLSVPGGDVGKGGGLSGDADGLVVDAEVLHSSYHPFCLRGSYPLNNYIISHFLEKRCRQNNREIGRIFW